MEKYKKNAIIGLLIIIFILVIVFSNKSKNIEIEEKTLEDRELEEKTSLKTDDADADDTLAADLTLNNINYPSGKTCQEKFDGFYFENIFKWNGESELDTRNGYGDPNPVRDNLGDFPSFGLLKKNTEVYSDLDDNEIKIFKNIEIDGTCWILAEVQNEPGESPDMWFKEEQFCNYMNLKKDDEFVEITGCSDEDEVIDCFVEGNVDKICVEGRDNGCPDDVIWVPPENNVRKCPATIIASTADCPRPDNCCIDTVDFVALDGISNVLKNSYTQSTEDNNCYYCAENIQWKLVPLESELCINIKDTLET